MGFEEALCTSPLESRGGSGDGEGWVGITGGQKDSLPVAYREYLFKCRF